MSETMRAFIDNGLYTDEQVVGDAIWIRRRRD